HRVTEAARLNRAPGPGIRHRRDRSRRKTSYLGRAKLSQANIVRAANRRICDFVHRSANRKLLPGTGYYSTPFRGGLFGETESDAVAKQLSRSDVDVLWLGTNPCVARSLENIIHPPTGKG